MAHAIQAWDRVVPLIRGGPAAEDCCRTTSIKDIQVVNAHGQVEAATPNLTGKAPDRHLPRGQVPNVRAERLLCPPQRAAEGARPSSAFKVYQLRGFWVLYPAIPVVAWYAAAPRRLLGGRWCRCWSSR